MHCNRVMPRLLVLPDKAGQQDHVMPQMQFYSWRRDVAGACEPNSAHYAIAALERRMEAEGRRLTLVTQNVDRLHQAAGSRRVIELHGSIWDVCRANPRTALKDGPCWEDRRQPLCAALAGAGDPIETGAAETPREELPHDAEGWLLRPGVVWFNETLDPSVLEAAENAVSDCEIFMTVGTSAVVYPAAGFAHKAAAQGVPVAEINLETSGSSGLCTWSFRGKAGEVLPAALGVEREVLAAVGRAKAATAAAKDAGPHVGSVGQ